MQMKMVKTKFDKKKIRSVLEKEDEFITNLFTNLEIPESIEDEDAGEQYLLESTGPAKKKAKNGESDRAQSAEELKERMETMRNKMSSKKSKPSDRALKKKQEKKMKKSRDLKKKLISAAKSIKNEQVKEGKVKAEPQGGESKVFDGDEVKPVVKTEKVFNEEGKIVFSKFEFAATPSQAKKGKKDKNIRDPKLLLQKIKKQKDEITELIEQGDTEKAEELKKSLAWRKAFDKTDGKKVKDNATLLHRSLKKKKTEKKKSKLDWKKREEKVEKQQSDRQKKRETNINKKKDDKKKYKLKKQAKRGRIIPGY